MDYREKEERDRLLHVQFVNLMQEIGSLLPDWKKGNAGEETVESRYWRPVFEKNGMKFGITREQGGKQDKITISAWSWPSYTIKELGHESKTSVTPRDLRRDESSPEISCSIARGADAIVKDIKRRFLPDYERLYAECSDRATNLQKVYDAHWDCWTEVCEILGNKNPAHSRHYFGPMSIEKRSSGAKVEIDVTPEQLRKLIHVMGYTNDTK